MPAQKVKYEKKTGRGARAQRDGSLKGIPYRFLVVGSHKNSGNANQPATSV